MDKNRDRARADSMESIRMAVMSKTQYAKARGVSTESVRKWKHRGWLVLTSDGKVDVEKSDARITAMRSNRGGDHSKPAAEKPAGSRDTVFHDAKLREQVARADMAELERDEKAGRLVLRAAVEKAARDDGVRLRDAVISVPVRIASRLALESDPVEVERLLDAELRRALAGIEPGEFGGALDDLEPEAAA